MKSKQRQQRFIIKTFDDDIYILDGYSSQAEIDQKLSQVEKAEMPNGDIIRTATVAKIMTYESYRFQTDQKSRHRKGQFLKNGAWWDHGGEVLSDAGLQRISGTLKQISPQNKLLLGD